MTDQQLNADLGANGHPDLPTAAMVGFAATGVSFVQSDAAHLAHAQECGGLMTDRMPPDTAVRRNGQATPGAGFADRPAATA